jgi:hypothetical protein
VPRAMPWAVENNVMNEASWEEVRRLVSNHLQICHAAFNFRTISRDGFGASHVLAAVPAHRC